MTRSKKKPSLHKPPFDEENALRFAEMETLPAAGSSGPDRGRSAPSIMDETLPGKGPHQERLPITLRLKSDTITTLQHEAGRKGKAIDQIIDKLVAKHLGKH
jgi:hypothetical protein